MQSEQRLNRISGGVVLGLSLFAMVLVLGATVLALLGRLDPARRRRGYPCPSLSACHRSARADGADIPRDGQLAPSQADRNRLALPAAALLVAFSALYTWSTCGKKPRETPRFRDRSGPGEGLAGPSRAGPCRNLALRRCHNRAGRESGSAPSCRSRVRWGPPRDVTAPFGAREIGIPVVSQIGSFPRQREEVMHHQHVGTGVPRIGDHRQSLGLIPRDRRDACGFGGAVVERPPDGR